MEEKDKLEKQKKLHQSEIAVIDDQKTFLKEIRVHTTKSISTGFERRKPEIKDWRDTLHFLGEEANRLNVQVLEIQTKIEAIDEEIRLIDASLKQVASLQQKVRKQIQIEVEVHEAGEFHFEVSYLVHNAYWRPAYDARVDSNGKKVVIRYYGSVVQRSGEDWKDVKVILSTARPHIGGNAPTLRKWALAVQPDLEEIAIAAAPEPEMMRSAPAPKGKSRKKRSAAAFAAGAMREQMDEASVAQTQVIAGDGASVLFTPQGSSDIPGNGSNTKLLIMEDEFGSQFKYLTIPKLSTHVYLSAKVKNHSEYPLLPGQISIFLDNSFSGKAAIKELVTPDEEFELSLGVDEAIKVKHQLKKKFGDEKGLFNKSKTQQYTYQIELNNQRATAESIIVRDQIPVSEDDEIKVKLDKIDPVESDEKNEDEVPGGTLEWKVTVPPREKRQVEFSFTVSHGKEIKVDGI